MLKTFLLAGLVLSSLHSARAVPLLTTPSSAMFSTAADRTWGWAFSTTRSLAVDAIGFFDAGGDGLDGPHQVGIWNSSGTLLASALITSSSTLVDGYRYNTLASLLVLSPGTYTLGALSAGAGRGDRVPGQVPFTALPGVTFLGNRDVQSSTFQRPTTELTPSDYNPGFFTVNLNIVPELDPASSGLSLALAGTLFALLAGRRKK